MPAIRIARGAGNATGDPANRELSTCLFKVLVLNSRHVGESGILVPIDSKRLCNLQSAYKGVKFDFFASYRNTQGYLSPTGRRGSTDASCVILWRRRSPQGTRS
jgi:hypothetical protein